MLITGKIRETSDVESRDMSDHQEELPSAFTTTPPSSVTLETLQQAFAAMREQAQQNSALVEALDKLSGVVQMMAGAKMSRGTFPLDKRECFAAFVLMGLSSRLQPIQVNNLIDKKKVVDLSFEMADMALANCAPDEGYCFGGDR